MKFDVIIGNPPYQVNTSNESNQAKPIYNIFVDKSKEIKPNYISLLIPARWYTGGMGLDKFRDSMINDNKLSRIFDFKFSQDIFRGVDIKGGICYFLWDSKNEKGCLYNDGVSEIYRNLSEFGKLIVRDNISAKILRKINYSENLSNFISSINPFGIKSNFSEFDEKGEIKIYALKKIKQINKSKIGKTHESYNKYKVFISKAYGGANSIPIMVIGRPILGNPTDVCTETYLVAGYFDTEKEAINYKKYLKTKFVRYLISIVKNTQNFTKGNACFVPVQDFNEEWSDEKLYKKYNLTEDEINHIEESIRPME